MKQQKSEFISVWDPVVRIGHWTLVASFFTAYFTEDDFLSLHVWAGYVLGAVILFRLLWGFIGTRHARFSDFLYSPAKIAAYLRGLRKGQAAHYVGHNPAGGVMIVLLLICLSITVYTGLELYAVEENSGPLAALESNPVNYMVAWPISSAYADGKKSRKHSAERDEDGEDEEFWEELHDFFANLTLMLVIVHISGAVVSSYLHRENLVKAMITGKKARH